MNKKIIIIIAGIFFIILTAGIIFPVIRKSVPKALPTLISQQNQPSKLGSSLGSFEVPDNNQVVISDVTVNNFYNNELNRSGGNVIFYEQNNIQVAYIYDINTFTITLSGTPFDQLKTQAESIFLSQLSINEQDACKLNVAIQASPFVYPERTDQTYRLSFCE